MFPDIASLFAVIRSVVIVGLGFFGPVFGAIEIAPEESTKNISVVRSTESFRQHAPSSTRPRKQLRSGIRMTKDNTQRQCVGFSTLYQQGIASWYGPGFHGKQMANGATYNMHGLTVAHRKLPLGTHVCIQNPENGKAVFATVTDRGPYIDGRIIDLSLKVAEVLGIKNRGVAMVTILL